MTDVSAKEENVVSLKAVKVAGPWVEQRISYHYCASLKSLVDDARVWGSAHLLAEELIFALESVLADYNGLDAEGDAVRKLGAHLCDLLAPARWKAEAWLEDEVHQPQ